MDSTNNLSGIIKINNCINCNSFIRKIPSSHINLLCIHINIRSIVKNYSKLLQIVDVSLYPIDIIILTEVGVTDETSNLFNIPGYKMYTKLRQNKKGGGIIIYIKDYLKFTLYNCNTYLFESLIGTIKTPCNQAVTICAIYRPPSYNKQLFVSELSFLLKNMHSSLNIIIAGDMNLDLKISSNIKDNYLNLMAEYGLLCGITEYTRIEKRLETITKSCLDHIL